MTFNKRAFIQTAQKALEFKTLTEKKRCLVKA